MESVHVIAATVGFTSFGLLWLSVLGGVALRNGWGLTRLRQPVAYALHQGVALTGLTLGLVHGLAQLAVPNGTIAVVEVIIPFVDAHDPIGTGAGVLGLELVLAAAISIVIQRRLGFSRWRAVHTATYAGFFLISAHVLVSGSDIGPWWVWGTVYTLWLATVALWFTTLPKRSRQADGPTLTATGPAQIHGNLRVDVDPVRCARFGFCEQEAPEVFSLQGDGRLDYTAAPPVTRLDDVIRAIEICPARAISVRHSASGAAPRPAATPATPHAVRQRTRTNTFEPATELDEYRQARGRHSRAQHHAAVHRDELTDEEQQ